jgi:hypothetical protein
MAFSYLLGITEDISNIMDLEVLQKSRYFRNFYHKYIVLNSTKLRNKY